MSNWTEILSPNKHTGRLPQWPVSGLVIHFTAAGSGKATADYFSKVEVSWKEGGVTKTAKVSASAHLVIDRPGTTYLCVPFTDRAWHAGPATLWKGKKTPTNVNNFTIGIELANWGPLTKQADGTFRTYNNRKYIGVTPFESVKDGKATYWEPYTEEMLTELVKVTKTIIKEFPAIGREDITGHEHIQGNKSDPGPAFPWTSYLDAVFAQEPPVVAPGVVKYEDTSIYEDHENEMCLDPNQAMSLGEPEPRF